LLQLPSLTVGKGDRMVRIDLNRSCGGIANNCHWVRVRVPGGAHELHELQAVLGIGVVPR
jgi:hypothetical protein